MHAPPPPPAPQAPFAPRALLEYIAAEAAAAPPSEAVPHRSPEMATLTGAVLVSDISGFTALTEKLSTRGSEGVELLTRCMNDYFGKAIALVLAHGGDVSKFAGDAMIIVFKPTKEEQGGEDKGLKAATLRAVRCAAALSRQLGRATMLPDGSVLPMVGDDDDDAAPAATAGAVLSEWLHRVKEFVAGVARRLPSTDVDAESCAPWPGTRTPPARPCVISRLGSPPASQDRKHRAGDTAALPPSVPIAARLRRRRAGS